MRILMLSAYPAVQGPLPKITPLLIGALRDLGCEVAFEPWGRHSDREGLLVKTLGRTRDLLRIRSRLRREEFDALVVNTSHEWPALLRDVPLLLFTRRPFGPCQPCPATILQFHGSQPDWLLGDGRFLYKALSTWLMQMCDAVLLLSSEERRQWEQFYPAGRFYVVSNPFVGAEPGETVPAPSAPTCLRKLPADAPVLLFVGRLMAEKGIFDLLDAVARLREQAACHLLVAGDGPQAQEVEQRVVALGLSECVTIAGYLKAEELAAAYRAATVFVLPTYWAEGFPTVVSEAMNAGLPIVTTNTRGVADHLQEGVNAVFVPPQDPETLADALARLLADPALQARMSQANREKVKEFAPEVIGRRYLGILEGVTGARQREISCCQIS